MIEIKKFTFNPFQENSYLLIDTSTKECFVIDPGCSNSHEEEELLSYIADNDLKPIRLINTHCHIDHILGNQLIASKFDLALEAHQLEIPVLASGINISQAYGIPYKGSPEITTFLEEGQDLFLGNTKIDILLTPGHSPGSVCLYVKDAKLCVGGDVLFFGSIGRTDLPGGDYNTLIGSILSKLMPLPDDTKVYSGHGPETSIGHEKRSNPFLNS